LCNLQNTIGGHYAIKSETKKHLFPSGACSWMEVIINHINNNLKLKDLCPINYYQEPTGSNLRGLIAQRAAVPK